MHEFSLKSPVHYKRLIQILKDHDNISKLYPPQIKQSIIKKNEKETIIEEVISTSLLNRTITQIISNTQPKDNTLETKIISGPLKDSIIQIIFEPMTAGTKIIVKIDLKLGLSYKFLTRPIQRKLNHVWELLINKANDLAILTNGRDWSESLAENGNALILSKNNFSNLKFYGWWFGDLGGIFVDEEYKTLPVNDQIVIDIGSGICDSSIYFAVNNARKVYALEPFPKNFRFAKKNVQVNNLGNIIETILAGIGNKNSEILVNVEQAGTSNSLTESKAGTVVQIMTLRYIIEKYKVDSAVLKMDCEGCEYNVISTTANETLSKFTDILIEYHNGYSNLKKRLEEFGFEATIKEISDKKGFLYAFNKTLKNNSMLRTF